MLARVTIALLVRQGVVQLTMVLCGVLLARALGPAEFGIYVLCTFLASFLMMVGDLGLGAFLARERSGPDDHMWRTTFTVRQISDLCVVALFLVGVPSIARWYDLGPTELSSLRYLALLLPLTSLYLVPQVRCERQLRFVTIAGIESAQILCYGAVILTFHDRGAAAFVAAWLAHALCGVVLYQLSSPWAPRWAWDATFIRRALPFSVPYQAAAAVHVARDGSVPLLVGALLGATAVGIANWAQMLAISIVLGAYVVPRGLLPGFARLIDRPSELTKAAESAVFCLYGAVLVLMGAIVLHAPEFARTVFGAQWLAALPYFYAVSLLNLFLPAVIVGGSILSALGRSTTVFRTMAASVVVLWIVGYIGMKQIGLWGHVGALLASQCVLLYSVVETRRVIGWKVIRTIAPVLGWLAIVAVAQTLCGSSPAETPLAALVHIGQFALPGALGVLFLFWRSGRLNVD